jgi:hypothetical protein
MFTFRRYIVYLFIVILSVFNSQSSKAQVLSDNQTVALIKRGVDLIYNLQIDEADKIFAQISKSYPQHPIIHLLKGLSIYWQNYPLQSTKPNGLAFEKEMELCSELSEKQEDSKLAAEYLLTNLSSRGMLLLYSADNELTMKVFSESIETYKNIRRSFNYTSSCADLYYFTGVYNYYREEYPKIYPVYKPLAIMFPSGDAATGLQNLNTCATSSVVMRVEAYFLLSYIYTNFENDNLKALSYSRFLHDNYPGNPLYLSYYIKNLLLLKRYDDAETELSSHNLNNKFYLAETNVLKGIIQEKKYRNNEMAESLYNKGITEMAPFGTYGSEYSSYAYFGLSRIHAARGKTDLSQKDRKMAVKLSDFKQVNFD